MRRLPVALLLPLIFGLVSWSAPDAIRATAPSLVKSGYAPVNGLELYYEIWGEPHPGRVPLVLIRDDAGGGVPRRVRSSAER